jgi:hypothetical protein
MKDALNFVFSILRVRFTAIARTACMLLLSMAVASLLLGSAQAETKVRFLPRLDSRLGARAILHRVLQGVL